MTNKTMTNKQPNNDDKKNKPDNHKQPKDDDKNNKQ